MLEEVCVCGDAGVCVCVCLMLEQECACLWMCVRDTRRGICVW